MAHDLYADEDPSSIFYSGQRQVLSSDAEGGYTLTIPLPFATKGEVTLRQTGDELFVHVGAYRRHIILPRALAGMDATRARLDQENAALVVSFASVTRKGAA